MDIEGFLPLKPDVFTILLVLAEADGHGYAIMQRARERSLGGGQLQPGALYRVLKCLLEDGLIREVDAAAAGIGDERRRTYRISALGREVAAAETRRMAGLVAASRAQRLIGEGEAH